MAAKYLYDLIDSLSSDQRRILTGFLKKHFGEKTKVFLLYSRINKRKPYTEKDEPRIRGKEFNSHDVYYQYRDKLTKAIIRCFLKERVSPLAFIKKALEFDAVDQAWKTLVQQLELAERQEQYSYMLQLYELLEELKASRFPGFVGIPSDGIASQKEVVEKVAEILELEQLLDEVRKAIKMPFKTRSLLHPGILAKLSGIHSSSPKIDYLRGKVNVYLSILMANHSEALEKQTQLLKQVRQWNGLSFPELIKEYSYLVQLCLIENRRDKAIRFSMEISSLEATNRRDKRLKSWSSIFNKVYVAERFCLPSLSNEAQKELASSKGFFEPKTYSNLVYSGALVAFYSQDYSNCIESITQLNSLRSEEREGLSWQVPVLLLATHFELGSVDILDHLFLRARRVCKGMAIKLPNRIIKMIRHLSTPSTSEDIKKRILQEIQEVDSLLLNNPDEDRASNFFNYSLWLKAKLEKASIADLISRNGTNNANYSAATG